MPELPEVETYRRHAEDHTVGRTLVGIECDDDLVLRNTTPQGLGRALAEATVTAATRHGKWVLLHTDVARDVVVHFGMTGSFHDHEPGEHHPEDYVRWQVDDGRVLALHMPRKLGGVWLARDGDEREEITGRLGPDALGVDADDLRAVLGDSRAGLKSGLMDQSKVAGVGNLLSDEVCWQVEVHPAARCRDLEVGTWDRVADELARALDVGLDLGHVPSTDGFLLDVRGEGADCPRCGTELASDTIAGRTSWWCPEDQPDPR